MANPIDNGPRVNGANVPARSRVQSGSEPSAVVAGNVADNAASEAATGAESAVASSRLQQIQERIDGTPEVDTARVEAIKQAIAEGNFPIDPARIAQKFVELEGLLNG